MHHQKPAFIIPEIGKKGNGILWPEKVFRGIVLVLIASGDDLWYAGHRRRVLAMYYFILPTLFSYNMILVAAAVIPAVFLMVKVYRSDRMEAESTSLLWSLMKAGILSSLLALVEERILGGLLNLLVPEQTVLHEVILYFGIVAFAEESSKYLLLKRRSWRSAEFDCQYDGVVYAVFVSLGFALWENISYVMAYGFGTALVRALTAIPGHACFGVFMGIFYGLAKKYERRGQQDTAKLARVLCVLIPALLHGAYDFIATAESGTWYFVVFILLLFAVSYYLVGKAAKNDQYI